MTWSIIHDYDFMIKHWPQIQGFCYEEFMFKTFAYVSIIDVMRESFPFKV